MGERQIEQHTAFDLPPGLTGQAQERSRDTALDALGGEFTKAFLELKHASGQEPEGILAEMRTAFQQRSDFLAFPAQHHAWLHCGSRDRIHALAQRCDTTAELTRPNEAQQDLDTIGSELGHLYPPLREHVESIRRIALPKQDGSSCNRAVPRRTNRGAKCRL